MNRDQYQVKTNQSINQSTRQAISFPGLCEGGWASDTRISLSSTSKLEVSVGEET